MADRQWDQESGGRQFDKNGRLIVSSAGAIGHTQVMPTTGPEAAKLAGLPWSLDRLKTDEKYNIALGEAYRKEMRRQFPGNERAALAAYNAGPNRVRQAMATATKRGGSWEQYIPGETQGYLAAITGRGRGRDIPANPDNAGQYAVRGTTARVAPKSEADVRAMAARDAAGAGLAPDDMGGRKPLEPRPLTAQDVLPAPKAAGILMGNPAERGIAGQASQEGTALPASLQQAQNITDTAKAEANAPSFTQRIDAAVEQNFISEMLRRGMDNKLAPYDPVWAKHRSDNWQELEAYAQDEDELELLRSPEAYNSKADYDRTILNIDAARKRAQAIGTGWGGFALNMGATMIDPVGWLATYGVGKVVQAGRVVATAGKAAVAAKEVGLIGRAAEGAIANVGFMGAVDYSGQPVSFKDYLWAGAAGVGIGAALHGVSRLGGRMDNSADDIITVVGKETAQIERELDAAARLRAGPNATPEQLDAARGAETTDRATRIMQAALGDRPDTDWFLPLDPELAKVTTKVDETKVATSTGLDAMADPAERGLAVEMHVRATNMVAEANATGALDKGLEGRFLKYFGQESDALTLLRSKSPIMQASAIQLLESTTGAGGRKASAAISKVMLERGYMRHMLEYDDAFDAWVVAEGKGVFSSKLGNADRAEFDRLIFREVEARGDDTPFITSNPAVRRGADAWERGTQIMADHMRAGKVLGHERLPTTSRGYMRHMLDGGKVYSLTTTQRRNVEGVLARQFQKLNEYTYTLSKDSKAGAKGEKVTKKFDAKFSRELSKRYLNEAVGRARGTQYVPVNLTNPDASEILRDALTNMQGLAKGERDAILEKYSRGGQSFTKGRLKLNLDEDIGDGMKLGDLFQQDILGMYRSYARKVSGDVALARYGIFGKKSLQLMRETGSLTGATADELRAFERITAEFVNEPWAGAVDYQAAKNLSAITSAVRLGGMAFTQAGELGNAIPAIGVKAALGTIPQMRRVWKELGQWRKGGEPANPILNDLDDIYGFIGGDGYNMTRLFDAPDANVELYGQEALGKLSKVARASSHFTMIVSGFRALHATQVRGLSEQIVKKAVLYMKKGEADLALADMGVTPKMIAAFKREMDAGRLATFNSSGKLTKLDLLGSELPPGMIHEFAQTVERGAAQIIQQTFIGETGAWAHNDFLKLLLKFRTFGITSIEKQFGRQMALGGGGAAGAVRVAAITMGAMAFALPIHLARLQAQSIGLSRSERDKFFEERGNVASLAAATSKYISISGLAPDVNDILATFGTKAGVLPESFNTGGARGNQAGSIVGLVPTLGVVNDVTQGAIGANPAKLMKLLPGNNLPYVTPIINGLTPSNE